MTNKELSQLPEAPASATLSVVTPKGYSTLFTLREVTGIALLDKIAVLETELEARGYKPQVKTFGGGYQKKEKVFVEGKKCTLCGGRIEKKVSKAGKEFYTCENAKYDFTTKQNVGCSFFEWVPVQPVQSAGVPERQVEPQNDPQLDRLLDIQGGLEERYGG